MKIIERLNKEDKILICNLLDVKDPRTKAFLETDFKEVGSLIYNLYIITGNNMALSDKICNLINKLVIDIIVEDPSDSFINKISEDQKAVYFSELYYRTLCVYIVKIMDMFFNSLEKNIKNVFEEKFKEYTENKSLTTNDIRYILSLGEEDLTEKSVIRINGVIRLSGMTGKKSDELNPTEIRKLLNYSDKLQTVGLLDEAIKEKWNEDKIISEINKYR